ncbi:MAG: hypothetical protein U1F34_01790 [Gammaproteobacteria bacterium]
MLLDTNEYRVVFVATQLPDIDGYEICRRAKQRGAVSRQWSCSPVHRAQPIAFAVNRPAAMPISKSKPITPRVLRHLLDQYLALS